MDGFVFFPLTTRPILWFFSEDFIAWVREEAWGFVIAREGGVDDRIFTCIFDDLGKDRPHATVRIGFEDMGSVDRSGPTILGAIEGDSEFSTNNFGEYQN